MGYHFCYLSLPRRVRERLPSLEPLPAAQDEGPIAEGSRQPGFVSCSVNSALGFAFGTLLYLLTYFILTRAKYSECRFHSVARVNEERHGDVRWFGQGSGNARMQLLASGSADFSCRLHRRWCDRVSATQMVQEADAQGPPHLSGVRYLRFSRSGLQVKCREHPHPRVSSHRPEPPGTGCARLLSACAVTLTGLSLISQLTSLVEHGFSSSQPDQGQPRLDGWRRWKPGEAVTFQKDLCLSGAGQRSHCPFCRRGELSS